MEEFELLPVDPIRKLEKRLERIEQGVPGYSAVLKDLSEMLKENQRVVDNLIKVNSELIANISSLSTSISNLVKKFDEFLNSIEIAGVEEQPPELQQIMEENKKLEQFNKELLKRLERLERYIKLATISPQGLSALQGMVKRKE